MSRHKEFHIVSHVSASAPRFWWLPLSRILTLATVFSLIFGGLLLLRPVDTSAQTSATVTEALNLRTGPGTDTAIIAVMPAGASVSLDGGSQNGFLSLSYNGSWGWAHSDWISTGGSAPVPAPSTGVTGTAYVIDGALNLRSGPSTGNSVVTVMPDGAAVSLTGESSGGFLSVVYNGTSGWAFAEYLSQGSAPAPSQPAPAPGNPGVGDTVTGTAVTTDSLNMRSGPSTSNGIITTMPRGASVEIMGAAQDGWYPVRYAGNKGWASSGWLSIGAAAPAPAEPTPAPAQPAPSNPVTIGDTVTGTMYVTTGLNLRSGPATSNTVITVMPGGATVSVMGAPVNGWYPLSFHGTKGWASGDYLSATAPALPNPPAESGYSRDEIIQIIYAAADKYGQPRADMLRVAQCESVLDPSVVNPASNASGLFQFLPGTWATTPYANQDIFDPVANAEAAAWMWANGRRNEWVCQ